MKFTISSSIPLCLALLAASAQAQIGGQGGMQQQGGDSLSTSKPTGFNMPGAGGAGTQCNQMGQSCSSPNDCCTGLQCSNGQCRSGGVTPPQGGGDNNTSGGGLMGSSYGGGGGGKYICQGEVCVAFSESIHIGQASFAVAYAQCFSTCGGGGGHPHPHGRCSNDGDSCSNDRDCCSKNCQRKLGGNGMMCGPKNSCKNSGDKCSVDGDCCSGRCQNLLGGNGRVCSAGGSPPSPPTPSCVPKKPLADCIAGTFNPCCSQTMTCSAKFSPQYPNDEKRNYHRCHPIDCAQDSDCPSGTTCSWGEWRGTGTGFYNACSKK